RRVAGRRDLSACVARVARPSALDVHAGFVGFREAENSRRERPGFILCEELLRRLLKERLQAGGTHQTFLPVLMMFTPRKRAGGQPWLMELSCSGSPLPSENVPPSQ